MTAPTSQLAPFANYLLFEQVGRRAPREVWRGCRFAEDGRRHDLLVWRLPLRAVSGEGKFETDTQNLHMSYSLEHPNLAAIDDLGSAHGFLYLAGERVFGQSLLSLLIRCTRVRLRLPVGLAVYIARQYLAGLEACHLRAEELGYDTRCVREFSPANIFLSYEGGIKIGHRGLRPLRPSDATNRIIRSAVHPGYVSPEESDVLEGNALSDIFRAGVILFEMLAMKRFREMVDGEPRRRLDSSFVAKSLANLPNDTPTRLTQILRKVFAINPSERFQTANTMAKALSSVRDTDSSGNQEGLSRFMKSIFAREVEQERKRRRGVRKQVESLDEKVIQLVRTTQSKSYLKGSRRGPLEGEWTPDSRFRSRDFSGRVLGPLNEMQIREALTDGPECQIHSISVDGAQWMVPACYQALLDPKWGGLEAGPMFDGYVRQMDIPRLIYRYAVSEATGRLRFESPRGEETLYWRNGRIQSYQGSHGDARLASYFGDAGLIDGLELERVRATCQERSISFAEALIAENIMDQGVVLEHISAYVREQVLALFGWSEGLYAFFDEDVAAQAGVRLGASVFATINEGIQQWVESDDILRFFEKFDNPILVRMRHHNIDSSNLMLSTRQLRLWNTIRTGERLDTALERAKSIPGADVNEFVKVVFLTERVELLAFAHEPQGNIKDTIS